MDWEDEAAGMEDAFGYEEEVQPPPAGGASRGRGSRGRGGRGRGSRGRGSSSRGRGAATIECFAQQCTEKKKCHG
eukprot:7470644-Pyramimonas_sp.AAC.2